MSTVQRSVTQNHGRRGLKNEDLTFCYTFQLNKTGLIVTLTFMGTRDRTGIALDSS